MSNQFQKVDISTLDALPLGMKVQAWINGRSVTLTRIDSGASKYTHKGQGWLASGPGSGAACSSRTLARYPVQLSDDGKVAA